MKAIEVKKGDIAFYRGEIVTVWQPCLNNVIVELSCGAKETVSYSQIKKVE